MMRIITGKAKGVRLETLDGINTRPTAERAKEAVFSMIQFEIEGRRVLDLFAGSGQMGLEALSRGAAEAVLVDHAKAAAEVIKKNVLKTKLDGAKVVCSDSLEYLRSGNIMHSCRYANAVGALVVSRAGASTSIPTEKELAEFIKENEIKI